jgi:hypothetical protein
LKTEPTTETRRHGEKKRFGSSNAWLGKEFLALS